MFQRRHPLFRTILASFSSSSSSSSLKGNPYTILGVKGDATQSEIKKAYLQSVKKYHPDTNKDPKASTKFIEVQAAFELLSDKERKANFDNYGSTEENPSAGGGGGFNPHQHHHHSSPFDASEIFNNIFGGAAGRASAGGGGFGSFESIFRDATGNGNNNEYRSHDPNLSVLVNLDFMEAARGCKKEIVFNRLENCSSCAGSGDASGRKMLCKNCNGAGEETIKSGGVLYRMSCRRCGGVGRTILKECKSCRGEGLVKKRAHVPIDVVAGISSGDLFSIPGEGNRLGDRSGNVTVQFQVSKHRTFTKVNDDIHIAIDIPLKIALCGGMVEVPTIDGNVMMKIDPGCQPGVSKKLSLRGINNGHTGHRGDQIVKVNIKLPVNLDSNQRLKISQILDGNSDEAGVRGERVSMNGDNYSTTTNTTRTTGEEESLWTKIRKAFNAMQRFEALATN